MKNAKDYIVFPLDLSTLKEAKHYIRMLSGHVGMFKVGLELFIKSGPEIVNYINKYGKAKVFLDLKLHDIPETVQRAMKIVADLDVAFATVHCGESAAMLKAAVKGGGGKVGVLGVTVLTSVSKDDIRTSGFKDEFSSDMASLVVKRAMAAKDAGCTGIVCSGLEVKLIKEKLGKDFIAVTPGIRPLWEAKGQDDQKRITTPAMAIKSGSDYIVIGRPIRDAKDPIEAAKRVAEEIETIDNKA